MTNTSVPVVFPNKDGLRLFGVFHRPAEPRESDLAILLLSPGVKMRVAPHRLYNKMADEFVAMGFQVLRFDFHGLGDSEGEAPDELLADLYGATQAGRYVNDTLAAMDYLQQAYGITRFIAAGLCGGALTGLLAGARDPRIVSLCGLSIPVIVDGSTVDASRFMTEQQLEGNRQRYLSKFNPLGPGTLRSWVRFVTFQSDYRLIARALMARFRKRDSAPRTSGSMADPVTFTDNTNPLFAPACHRMLSTSRPILLIFAGSDRLLFEYETKFVERHRQSLEQFKDLFDVHVTPHANHIFGSMEWHADMMARCRQWLDVRVPEPVGHR